MKMTHKIIHTKLFLNLLFALGTASIAWAQGETATAGFLDEVETFLIEAEHTPDSATVEEVRDLRDRIESGSLLFKVRIVESNLRNEEQKL